MSDKFTNDPLPDSDEGDEAALRFERCSKAKCGAEKNPNSHEAGGLIMGEKKIKAAVTEGVNDDLAMHREHPATPPNLRRSQLVFRQGLISLSNSVIIGLLVLYAGKRFYLHEIAPRLPVGALPAAAPAAAAATESALKAELAQSAEQIIALQKQVDVMRREQLLMQQNTRESLESISTTLKNPQLVPPPVQAATGQPGIARMAEMKQEVSPTQQEFIQLKERNRLTQYADEAIATGARRPLEVLLEYMRDPDVPHLHDAAHAEFMRAVRAIQLLQREDPGYRLPVAELFKDSSIRDEADVKPEALLKLLADYKQPWEVRVRVCFLLLGSQLPETNAQLIKAIKEDPSLDVAKHAQLSLEQRIKKRFRIFDIPAIEEWFKAQDK